MKKRMRGRKRLRSGVGRPVTKNALKQQLVLLSVYANTPTAMLLRFLTCI
jgi:hypothetical protein